MHSFPRRGREGALREGFAITFWLLGMNCAASCRGAEGKRERGRSCRFPFTSRGIEKGEREKSCEGKGPWKTTARLTEVAESVGPRFGEFFPCCCASAYHLCLTVPAKFSQPEFHLFGKICISGRNWKVLRREDHRKGEVGSKRFRRAVRWKNWNTYSMEDESKYLVKNFHLTWRRARVSWGCRRGRRWRCGRRPSRRRAARCPAPATRCSRTPNYT